MAQNIPSYVPKDGLVGYWPFNGNANDESGNGNHGTNNGATLTIDRNGVANSAYSFDGQKDFIQCLKSGPIKNASSTSVFWLKSTQQSYAHIIGYGDDGNEGKSYRVTINQNCNSCIAFDTYGNEKGFETQFLNMWDCYAVVYDSTISSDISNVKIYKNGALLTNISFLQNITNTDISSILPITFGRFHGTVQQGFFSGLLDDIAIYNRALTEKEITALYTGNVASVIPSYVPIDGLVGWWPFNGNANDESGNGNNGVNYGATLTYDKNGAANSAYSFNGNEQYILTNEINKTIQDKTFSAWVKLSTLSQGGGGIVGLQSEGGAIFDAMVYNEQNGGWFFGSDNYTRSSNSYQFEKDTSWIHMVYTYKNNDFKMYRNGVLFYKDSNYTNNIFQNGTFIGIGMRHKWGGNNYINATIDDVSLYNRALSEQEITNLYTTCSHEQASSDAHNSILFATGNPIELAATPAGGTFISAAIKDGKFTPTAAKIGLNKIQYAYKNSQGCDDMTEFQVIVSDTAGTKCTKMDTVVVTKTKYDTVTVKNNVYDTVTVTKNVTKYDTITVTNNVTKYDTVIVTNNVTKYDTVKVNKYDTITITNNVTKYDTVIVKTNVFDTVKVNTYDTITVTNNVTKYDTVIVPKTVTKYDTVKINTYDTITVTNSVTKYDTVIVNQTKYDTITVTNSVTKYDTVLVNKYDTITVTDTVNILKINFKLTTGIKANQMTSMIIYPNPTSDVLIIDASDLTAVTGYSYRILDVLGKEVYNALVTSAKTEISLKTLGAKGMYVLHILDANKLSVQTKQIVLE